MKSPLRAAKAAARAPKRRGHRRRLAGVTIESLAACTSTPEFVPAPSKIYAGYSAIDEPRENVPVGALWVQGYGPYGEGAAPDNLITLRSLSGYSLSGDLQLALSFGLASVLDLDPAYRKRISAKFSDLSIVRVKDVSKLAGPADEPRIYEAVRAGSITITAEKALGIDLKATAKSQNLIVLGNGDPGQAQTITIDGKDLFLAFRVVVPGPARKRPETVPIRIVKGEAIAAVQGHRVTFDTRGLERCLCNASSPEGVASCRRKEEVPVLLSRDDSTDQLSAKPVGSFNVDRDNGQAISLPLHLPVSDGRGGLLTSLSGHVLLDLEAQASPTRPGPRCMAKIKRGSRLEFELSGDQLRTFPHPSAPTW